MSVKVYYRKSFLKIIAISMKPASCIVSVYSDQRVCITQSEHCPPLAKHIIC